MFMWSLGALTVAQHSPSITAVVAERRPRSPSVQPHSYDPAPMDGSTVVANAAA